MASSRAGYLAPALAVALAVFAAIVAFDRYQAAWRERSTTHAARMVADEVARGARAQLPGSVDARVLVDTAEPSAKWPFLMQPAFTWRSDGGALGALRPFEDKAWANAFGAGSRRAGEADVPGGKRVWRPATQPGAVVAVHAPRLPGISFVGWLLLAGLPGLLGWLLLVRSRAAPWTAAAGAAVSFVGLAATLAWLESTLLAQLGPASPLFDGRAPPELIPGGTLLFAAPLLPLVCFAIGGWITRSRRSPHRAAYIYVAPAMVGMAVLILVPFTLGLALAFTRHDHGVFTWVGLQNFASILGNDAYSITHPLNFYFTLGVTILWTATNVLLHVSIGLGLALILKSPTLKLKGVYRVLLIMPWAVPNYITALVWKGMFNKQYGLVNTVLDTVGVEPVSWFASFWTAFSANLTTNTWLGFPFMMVIALGALQSIPGDLYEAAEVDGATRWQQFRHITLPLLKPALLPAVILGSIWTFNMFNIIYLVSGGAPNQSTDILITEAYRWAFDQDRYGYAAAYSVLIFLVLLAYSLVTSRIGKASEAALE